MWVWFRYISACAPANVRPTVIVTVPEAVALADIVMDVDDTVAIVAAAGIPVPEIGIPA